VIFIVTYDLKSPNDTEVDYRRVINAIKGYGTWCHVEKSVWLVSADDEASSIRDHLKTTLYPSDVLFVGKLSGNWASFNLGPERSKWLKEKTF
jgi:hypothetical protein